MHLSRQHYKACVRKGAGKGYICYWMCTAIKGAAPGTTVGTAITLQVSDISINCAILVKKDTLWL